MHLLRLHDFTRCLVPLFLPQHSGTAALSSCRIVGMDGKDLCNSSHWSTQGGCNIAEFEGQKCRAVTREHYIHCIWFEWWTSTDARRSCLWFSDTSVLLSSTNWVKSETGNYSKFMSWLLHYNDDTGEINYTLRGFSSQGSAGGHWYVHETLNVLSGRTWSENPKCTEHAWRQTIPD